MIFLFQHLAIIIMFIPCEKTDPGEVFGFSQAVLSKSRLFWLFLLQHFFSNLCFEDFVAHYVKNTNS